VVVVGHRLDMTAQALPAAVVAQIKMEPHHQVQVLVVAQEQHLPEVLKQQVAQPMVRNTPAELVVALVPKVAVVVELVTTVVVAETQTALLTVVAVVDRVISMQLAAH
jgi:hypothetical protein